MRFNKQYNDPQNYYWFKEGFSKQELDRIYEGVATLEFNKASTLGDLNPDKKVRSSNVKWIPQNSEWKWLYDKMMDMSVEANGMWGFDLIAADELIQYTEYLAEDDGHYTWHQDIGPDMASLRKISITVQLSESDEYEGGDLELWMGGDSIIKAARGAGVVFIFPSYMMHRVTPVTKGKRRSFVLWVGGQHYK